MSEVIRLTGGCQCGAVRYVLHQTPGNPDICHCRMCQKAFGSFFAPLAAVERTAFELTRGHLSTFMSSSEAERGFCANCGTPLSFRYVSSPNISVSIGSLDHPEQVPPKRQYGIEARMSWFAQLAALPGEATERATSAVRLASIRASNRQHPDHDTAAWPAADGEGAR